VTSIIELNGAERINVFHFAANRYGLCYLLDLFEKKFSQVDYSLIHVLKSLTYFKDAENKPMPPMLIDISWGEIAEFFRKEAPQYCRYIHGLESSGKSGSPEDADALSESPE